MKLGKAGFWIPLIGAALTVVISIIVGQAYRLGPTDDAYIVYRNVQNFVQGHGLVYNPGEPVEAISNFLFALLLGLLGLQGIGPVNAAKLVNLISLGAIAFMVLRSSRRRLAKSRAGAWFSTSGAVILAVCPSMILYVWAGLETVFYTALLLAACITFQERSRSSLGLGLAGILFGLAASTRMEAVIALPVAMVAMVLERGFKSAFRDVTILSAGFVVVFMPTFIFRWWTYGFPFPNTYYVKVHGGGLDLTLRGLLYIAGFLLTYIGFTVILFVSGARFVRAKSDRFRTGFFLLMILAQIAYVIFVGGDFFPFYRFMVPIIPLIALLFVDLSIFGTHRVAPKLNSNFSNRPGFPFIAIMFMAVASGGSAFFSIGDATYARWQQASAVKRTKVGKLLRSNVPKDATLLIGAAGAIPYFSRLRTYDVYGLTDPVVAHKRMQLGKGLPGHEKVDAVNQVFRLKPDLILFSSWRNDRISRWKEKLRYARWHQIVDQNMKQYEFLPQYFLMRLRNASHTAMVAVRKDAVYKLGGLFDRIGKARLRPLSTPPHLGDTFFRFEHLKLTPSLSKKAPVDNPELDSTDAILQEVQAPNHFISTRLISEIIIKAGLEGWNVQMFSETPWLNLFEFGCSLKGFEELSTMCTHLLSPFVMNPTFLRSEHFDDFVPFWKNNSPKTQLEYHINTEGLVDGLVSKVSSEG